MEVLRQIKCNFIHKKSRKKVDKFIKNVETHKEISLKRITFFVYWFQRIFKNIQNRSKEINIRNFVSREESTICMDKDHKSGKCPELIVKRKGDTKISSILMDKGAETNILGVETLEQVLKDTVHNHNLAQTQSTIILKSIMLKWMLMDWTLRETKRKR